MSSRRIFRDDKDRMSTVITTLALQPAPGVFMNALNADCMLAARAHARTHVRTTRAQRIANSEEKWQLVQTTNSPLQLPPAEHRNGETERNTCLKEFIEERTNERTSERLPVFANSCERAKMPNDCRADRTREEDWRMLPAIMQQQCAHVSARMILFAHATTRKTAGGPQMDHREQ